MFKAAAPFLGNAVKLLNSTENQGCLTFLGDFNDFLLWVKNKKTSSVPSSCYHVFTYPVPRSFAFPLPPHLTILFKTVTWD